MVENMKKRWPVKLYMFIVYPYFEENLEERKSEIKKI